MEEVDRAQVKSIMQTYVEVVNNTRRALIFAGVPERLTFFYIFIPPQFQTMLPEDVIDFYRDIQKAVIIYLSGMGFSQREIARRLRGGSYALVVEALQSVKNSKKKHGKSDNGQNSEGKSENGSSTV